MSTGWEEEEYTLGEDVTHAAKAKARGGTAVLSVRLPHEEFAQVEAWAQAEGKTLSQVVREALKLYSQLSRSNQPTVTISISGGGTSVTGAPLRQWGKASMVKNEPSRICTF